MYIDPPYPGNGVNYRHNMRSWEEHRNLAERLGLTKCRWILSSYDVPKVRELYERYQIIPVQSYSGMRTRKNSHNRVLNKEVLIINFPSATLRHSSMEENAVHQTGFGFGTDDNA